MEYLYPLNAINRDGSVILLYSKDDVYKFIAKYGIWEDYHKYTARYYDPDTRQVSYHVSYREWIVRDDRGRKVKFEDVRRPRDTRQYWKQAQRDAAAKGLPIPGTGGFRKCWKMNHTAKKNSGSGHRNRNRARFVEDFKEYGIRNNGGKPIPYEHW